VSTITAIRGATAHRVHPEAVGQPEVEEDAVDLARQLAERLAHGPDADQAHVERAPGQQLLDEQRVAVIVLDEEHADLIPGAHPHLLRAMCV
jgi:hypothetical protein